MKIITTFLSPELAQNVVKVQKYICMSLRKEQRQNKSVCPTFKLSKLKIVLSKETKEKINKIYIDTYYLVIKT